MRQVFSSGCTQQHFWNPQEKSDTAALRDALSTPGPIIAVRSQQQSVPSSPVKHTGLESRTLRVEPAAPVKAEAAQQVQPNQDKVTSAAAQTPASFDSALLASNPTSGFPSTLASHQPPTVAPVSPNLLNQTPRQASQVSAADKALPLASASPTIAAAPLELPGALDSAGLTHQVAPLQAISPASYLGPAHNQTPPQPSQNKIHPAHRSLDSLQRTPAARPPSLKHPETISAALRASKTRHEAAKQSQPSTTARASKPHAPVIASAQQPGSMHSKFQSSSIQDLQHVVCSETTTTTAAAAAVAAAAAAAKTACGDGRPPPLRRSSSGSNVKANVPVTRLSTLASAGRSQSLTDSEATTIQPRAEEAGPSSPQQGVPVFVMLPLDTVRPLLVHLKMPASGHDSCPQRS